MGQESGQLQRGTGGTGGKLRGEYTVMMDGKIKEVPAEITVDDDKWWSKREEKESGNLCGCLLVVDPGELQEKPKRARGRLTLSL